MGIEKVRLGVIGAGIGSAHVEGMKNVEAGEVVAICDLNTARAEEVAARHHLENVTIYADYRDMLDKGEVDAVSVGLPNSLHKPVAIACLDAGKHVLCEKPLALSAAEGQEIADAAARNNRQCMVGQVNRQRADSKFCKQAIEDGLLGELYYAHTGWLRKRGIPGYGSWFTIKEQSGGGPLIDIGVHMLDIAWWLCGCPQPLTVSGSTFAKFGPRKKGMGGWGTHNLETGKFNVEDLALAVIRFEGGITINLEVSWAIHNRDNSQWCQVFGDEGGLDWGNNTGLYRDFDGTPVNAFPELPKGDAWHGQMSHFVDCVLNDKTPDPDVTQGVTMMKMLDAIYQSAEAGREVEIG